VVPIVPAAVLYDLEVGDPKVRPDAEMGYEACFRAASGKIKEGNVGAGTGAVVHGFGGGWLIKGGLGTASIELDNGIIVGAIVAVNAAGSVVNENGEFYYKMQGVYRDEDGDGDVYIDKTQLVVKCDGRNINNRDLTLQCTTIGVIATNARLTKTQMTKVAQMAQDGIAMAIRPAHTMYDGDTIFALSVGEKSERKQT
jgi:L-aminopeptidase/D-esterase